MSSNLLPLSPMATETVTGTTVPNHDETELTEFQKNQKRYQDLISTLPHVKGWRPKAPLIGYGGHWWIQPFLEGSLYAQEFFQARPNDFLICSYPKTGSTWLKSLTFTIAHRSRFNDLASTIPQTLSSNVTLTSLFLSLRSSSLCSLTLMFSKTKGTLSLQLICHTISYPIRL